MRPSLRWPALALLFVLAPLTACGGGGGGDASYRPDPIPLSYYNNPANPRPSETDYISLSNVVITAVDQYDETGTGSSAGNLFVQDMLPQPKPYSGITVYNPGFTPPDLRVFPGDVVDVRSPYQEFPGPSSSRFPDGETLPELSGASVKFRYEAPALPAPMLITPDELYDYASGRQWIGVLCELQNVTLFTDVSDSKGRWTAQLQLNDMAGRNPGKLPNLTNALYPMQDDTRLNLTKGARFNIRGIVQYFYTFSISPRSADDIQPAS